MIIMEMDAGGQAFHALLCAFQDPSTYRVRIALDEGEFKIKVNEDTWTPELEHVNIKRGGGAAQLLRDLGLAGSARALDEILGDLIAKGPQHA